MNRGNLSSSESERLIYQVRVDPGFRERRRAAAARRRDVRRRQMSLFEASGQTPAPRK